MNACQAGFSVYEWSCSHRRHDLFKKNTRKTTVSDSAGFAETEFSDRDTSNENLDESSLPAKDIALIFKIEDHRLLNNRKPSTLTASDD